MLNSFSGYAIVWHKVSLKNYLENHIETLRVHLIEQGDPNNPKEEKLRDFLQGKFGKFLQRSCQDSERVVFYDAESS